MVDADIAAFMRQRGGAEDGDGAVAALQCNGQRTGAATLRKCAIGAVPQRNRQKFRVEDRAKLR